MRACFILVSASMLVLVCGVFGASAQDATETPTPSPEIAAIIASVAGAVDSVDTVTIPNDAKRVVHIFVEPNAERYDVTVVYHTAETGDFGYNSELIDVFRAIGHTMQTHLTPLGTLSLVPALTLIGANGLPLVLETVSVDGEALNAFVNNEMSRSLFMRHWVREPGNLGGATPPGQPT